MLVRDSHFESPSTPPQSLTCTPHPKLRLSRTLVWVCKQARGGWRPALTLSLCAGVGGKERDQHADREHTFQLKKKKNKKRSPLQAQPQEIQGSLVTVWKPYSLAPASPAQLGSKLGTFRGFQAALLSPGPGAVSTVNLEVCQVHTLVRVTGTNGPLD